MDLALENGNYKLIKLLRSYGAQTGHCMLSNAAIRIQHYWKMYRKRCFPKSKETICHGSLCNSSNASESVSVLEAKRNQEDSDLSTGCYQALSKKKVGSLESLTTHILIHNSLEETPLQNIFSNFLTESYKKEFKERIADGVSCI